MAESFENNIIYKIDNKINLSYSDLERLVWEYAVDRIIGRERRYQRNIKTIVKLNDRYFLIPWEEGLTLYHENQYFEQPYEVEKNEYDKMVHITEWIKK